MSKDLCSERPLPALCSRPRLISSASSDSGLSSISAKGRMSSSELTISPPNVYISAQLRFPP
jgi:hypothetical protein